MQTTIELILTTLCAATCGALVAMMFI